MCVKFITFSTSQASISTFFPPWTIRFSFTNFSLKFFFTWLIWGFWIFNWSVASVFYSIFLSVFFSFVRSFTLPFIEGLFQLNGFNSAMAEMRGGQLLYTKMYSVITTSDAVRHRHRYCLSPSTFLFLLLLLLFYIHCLYQPGLYRAC